MLKWKNIYKSTKYYQGQPIGQLIVGSKKSNSRSKVSHLCYCFEEVLRSFAAVFSSVLADPEGSLVSSGRWQQHEIQKKSAGLQILITGVGIYPEITVCAFF